MNLTQISNNREGERESRVGVTLPSNSSMPDTHSYACQIVRSDGYCPQIDSHCPYFAHFKQKGEVIQCEDWGILEVRRMR